MDKLKRGEKLSCTDRLMKHNRGYFTHNILVIRHFKMMSIPQFASLLKVDAKRLQEVETGRLNPNAEEIKALSLFTGFSLESLISSKLKLSINFDNGSK